MIRINKVKIINVKNLTVDSSFCSRSYMLTGFTNWEKGFATLVYLTNGREGFWGVLEWIKLFHRTSQRIYVILNIRTTYPTITTDGQQDKFKAGIFRNIQ